MALKNTKYRVDGIAICYSCGCALDDQREIGAIGWYVCEQCAADEDAAADNMDWSEEM